MKTNFLIFLSVFIFFTKAENQKPSKLTTNYSAKLNFTKLEVSNPADENLVKTQILNQNQFLKDPENDLFLIAKTVSPAGFHYLFQQTYLGIPIYLGTIKVNTDKSAILSQIFTIYDTKNWTRDLSSFANYSAENAKSDIYKKYENYSIQSLRKIVFVDADKEMPNFAYEINLTQQNQPALKVIISEGEILAEKDLKTYFNTDTTVNAYIYNPDPLTHAHVPYGGQYVDNNDATNASLDSARTQVQLTLPIRNGVTYLEDAFINIVNLNGAAAEVNSSSTGDFMFNRSQLGFESVNAFYHLTTQRKNVHNLGFNCADILLQIDPHGDLGDQSYFTEPNSINFGTGGVDDAEDADVPIHEYTHFLSNNASPNSNFGSQRAALDEAMGDYFAASYSRNLDSYNWIKVFNWDGNVGSWQGRIVAGNHQYPADVNTSSIYATSSIFSEALMEIWGDLGAKTTDSLVLQLLYMTAPNITLADAAKLMLQGDTILTGGKYSADICYRMHRHGLLSLCGYNGINEITTSKFSLRNTSNGFQIYSTDNASNLQVLIYDICGKEISNSVDKTRFDMSNFSNGMYLIDITEGANKQVLKWLKY